MRKSVSLSVSFRDGPEITQGQGIFGVRESGVLRFKRCLKARNWLIFTRGVTTFYLPLDGAFLRFHPAIKLGCLRTVSQFF